LAYIYSSFIGNKQEIESAPKLANPSKIKIENLKKGGYMLPEEEDQPQFQNSQRKL